jgi:hypothetical protein
VSFDAQAASFVAQAVFPVAQAASEGVFRDMHPPIKRLGGGNGLPPRSRSDGFHTEMRRRGTIPSLFLILSFSNPPGGPIARSVFCG